MTTFTCERCGAEFSSNFARSRHSLEHNDNRPNFTCSHCNKVFNRTDNCQRHEKSCLAKKNRPAPIFNCYKCGKVFPTKQNKERHEPICKNTEATDPNKARFRCGECNKTFASNFNLNRHMDLLHYQNPTSTQWQLDESEFIPSMVTSDDIGLKIGGQFSADESFYTELGSCAVVEYMMDSIHLCM